MASGGVSGASGAGGNGGSGGCSLGQRRSCKDAGAKGTCASGEQLCQADGTWGSCSIAPLASDSCALNNDDNCNEILNEGCLCISGATRVCGECQDGIETCADGKAGTWSACSSVTKRVTYYADQDADGYGSSSLSISVCGSAPAGYVAVAGDYCDSDLNVHPGQTSFFQVANACGNFDYDCNGQEEPQDLAPACPPSCVAGENNYCFLKPYPACGINVTVYVVAWVAPPPEHLHHTE
jgi:hypothetical protein